MILANRFIVLDVEDPVISIPPKHRGDLGSKETP